MKYSLFYFYNMESLQIFATIFAFLGAIAGEALFLTYGVLAVIPGGPFETRNLGLGVSFIVISCVGLAGIGGALAAFAVFALVTFFPALVFCRDRLPQ